MYRVVFTARTKNKKISEAIPAAKAITTYVNEKYRLKVDVYLQQFGPIGTIYWMSEYKDLDTIEKLNGQIMTDQGYWASVTGVDTDGKPFTASGKSMEVVRRQPDGTWLFAIDNPHGGE